jgi:hypothetical protein
VISIPVAVHSSLFRWQLDLLWFAHRQTYRKAAQTKILAVVIKRNDVSEAKTERLQWDIDVPHRMCEAFFDAFGDTGPTNTLHRPLNIQIGLQQVITGLADEQVVEVLDCDMFHLRPHPEMRVGNDELLVCDLYERWHLKSLGAHRNVIDIYFENGGQFYNGGFVPVIGKVKTFRKLLPEWIAVHRHILTRPHPELIHWWAGMYALQAACEKKRVRMRAKDYCYVPGINQLQDSHYICHYACDLRFDKRTYPRIDPTTFEDNLFYRRLRDWPNFMK